MKRVPLPVERCKKCRKALYDHEIENVYCDDCTDTLAQQYQEWREWNQYHEDI